MNLKPKVIAHETGLSSKITYVLQVTNQSTHKTKISKLRYSQFKDIHLQLQKVVSKLKLHIVLPEFPGRKFFGSTNKSQQSIFQRKKDLNLYLTNLLSIQKLHSLQIVKKYYIPEQSQVLNNSSKRQFNMQICIDRYTLVDDVVIYYVRIRDLNSHQQWTFKTRYSQLKYVHQALLQSKIKNLPEFPKKKIFGITNQSPEDIEKRRQQLQKYFNQIFSVDQVMQSQALKYFVQQSKKQAHRDKEMQKLKKKGKQ